MSDEVPAAVVELRDEARAVRITADEEEFFRYEPTRGVEKEIEKIDDAEQP